MFDNRKNLIAKIHIGKTQLKLDEETYRQLLQGITGKASCALMTLSELTQVLNALKRRGFQVQAKRNQTRPTPREDKAKYLAKITALLATHQLPTSYADSIAKKAFNIDFVHWLEPWQLKKVIQMLAVYDKRKTKQ